MKYQEACFSQMDVMAGRTDRNPLAATWGACHAFSIHWLRLVLSKSRSLPRDRMAEIRRDCGGINLLMQNVYESRYSPYECCESDQMLLRLRGLTSLQPISCPNYIDLLSRIYWTNGAFLYSFGYYRVVPGPSQEEGHTMAFYRMSVGAEGFIYVYDPNRGEFHVIPGDFRAFWWEFIAGRYGPAQASLLRPVIISDKDHLSGG